jgi:F0F1-type ATP synthase assembly protein I
MPSGSPNPRQMGRYLAIAQVGMEMVAPIGLGVALDYYLGWTPWATITGVILGLAGGLLHLFALAKQPMGPPSTSTESRDRR